jgi:DNA segregation ATPase FtsK/SpoIIIE-like protein
LTRRVSSPPTRSISLLQNSQQLGLKRGAAFTDLIEEQGAAVRQLKAAFPLAHRAGKRAFLMAEQLALQQGVRQRRAVKFDEGGGGAREL